MTNYYGVESTTQNKYKATAYCKQCREVKHLGDGEDKEQLAHKVARFKGCDVKALVIGPKALRGRLGNDCLIKELDSTTTNVNKKCKPLAKLKLTRDTKKGIIQEIVYNIR